MTKPLDKILCGGKFYRYVVACMHNCPHPHHCAEFWEFFNAIGKTPAEYYNEDGIGEKVMRRTVFDCDRCGKRDLLEVYGLYNLSGELAEDRLDEVAQGDMVVQAGHADEHVQRITFMMLDQLEAAKEWQHYCRACFKDVADGVSRMLKPPPQRTRKRSKLVKAKLAGKKDVAPPKPEPEPEFDPAEPELEVVIVPAPEPPEPSKQPEKPAKAPARKRSRKSPAAKAPTEAPPATPPEAPPAAEPAAEKPAAKPSRTKKSPKGGSLKL
jgi:hypothetical protein